MSRDGRTAACRQCLRDRDHTRYPKERESRSQQSRAWVSNNRERSNQIRREWTERNPDKRKAHTRVSNAVRDGRLERLPCEVCGAPTVEAHHNDYAAPLDVRWLCKVHHEAAHHTPEPRSKSGEGTQMILSF